MDNRPEGKCILIEAAITDDQSGVAEARLFYMHEDATEFNSLAMVNTKSTIWAAAIPGKEIVAGQMFYYLWARDGYDAWINESYLPNGAPDVATYSFGVIADE
jgi:hypothetical protein